MADTRKYDREEVANARENANTTAERENAGRTMHKINNESKKVSRLRENLIGAIRNGDHRARRRFERELRHER